MWPFKQDAATNVFFKEESEFRMVFTTVRRNITRLNTTLKLARNAKTETSAATQEMADLRHSNSISVDSNFSEKLQQAFTVVEKLKDSDLLRLESNCLDIKTCFSNQREKERSSC